MKRIIAALLMLGAAAVPARAWLAQGGSVVTPTYQVFLAAATSAASASADNFIPINYSLIPSATDGMYTMFPIAGTLSNMRVRINGTAPAGIQAWTITVRKNGADTALTCTVGSSSSSVCNLNTNVTFAAGDWGNILIHPANTPTVARVQVATLFQPTTANDTMISAWANGYSTSATQSQVPYSASSLGIPSARRYPGFPDGGTIDKLYIKQAAASGGASTGKQYVYLVDKNGSTAGMTITCDTVETEDSCNDTTHSVSVTGASGSTAGDDIQIQAAPTSTPTSAVSGIGLRYLPTTTGSFAFLFSTSNSDSATLKHYIPFAGGNSGSVTTESQVQSRTLAMTVTKMSVKLGTAPGAGKHRIFTLRQNSAGTALTCTIAGTDTACSQTGSVSFVDDDLVATENDPDGTSPATSQPSISYLANR